MPSAAKHPCAHPGCPRLVERGKSRCPEHEKKRQQHYDQERGHSAYRGYDARWRKVRAMKLAQDPLCEECQRPATEVHHIDGNPRHNTWDNLRSLCKSCHSGITAKEGGRWETNTL